MTGARRLVGNSFYSLLGMGGPLVVTLVTLPLLIAEIGLARFGVLALAWLVLSYFGQADFGLGRAITRRVGEIGAERPEEQARAVASAFILMAGIGTLAAIAAYGAGRWFFAGEMRAAATLRAEMLDALWLLALAAPLVVCASIAIGSLTALGRFRRVALANFVGGSAMQAFPLVAALMIGAELDILIAALLVGRLATLAILLPAVVREFDLSRSFRFDPGEARALLGFGKWIMLSALVGPLMAVLDRFVIGAMFGAALVAVYTVPFQIGYRLMIIPGAVLQVLFPHFVANAATIDARAIERFTSALAIAFAPVVMVVVCLADPLLDGWLGAGFDDRAVMVGRIAFVGFWINAVAYVPFARIQAGGDARFTGLLHLAELPFYLALMVVLGQWLGIAGLALAFALRCLIDAAVLLRRAQATSPRLVALLGALALPMIGTVLADPEGWGEGLIALAVSLAVVACVAALAFRSELAAGLAALRRARPGGRLHRGGRAVRCEP